MGRHAFLIIAHNQFDLLRLLLQTLDHPDHDVYLHVDRKAKDFHPEEWNHSLKDSSLFLIPRRNVGWGDYNMIQTELDLLEASTPKKYDYYHLLSGVDLPLQPISQIHRFFRENQGKELVHFSAPVENGGEDASVRVKYYHLWQNKVGRSQGALKRAANLFLKCQKRLGIDRLRGKDLTLRWGANWFSITHSLAQYVLSRKKDIRSLCRMSACADEVFLQTLVWNSPFRSRVYCLNDTGDYRSCMRYVDWERGQPYTFQNEDYEELIASGFLFARKFDYAKNPEICQRILSSVNESAYCKTASPMK